MRSERIDPHRFPLASGLSVSTAPLGSPTTIYSGPPPPYSSASSITGSSQALPGYISPPDTSSRRSTRDEKESPCANKSLPSISEALRTADMTPSSGPIPTTQSYSYTSAPSSAVGQSFADAPKGPGNPFFQPPPPAVTGLKTSFSSTTGPQDSSPVKAVPPPPQPPAPSEVQSTPTFGTSRSPRLNHPPPPPPPLKTNTSNLTGFQSRQEPPIFRSPFEVEQPRPGYPFPDYHNTPSSQPPSTSNFHFEHHGKFENQNNPFVKNQPHVPYTETVKRHLDVFDAELALKEVWPFHPFYVMSLNAFRLWKRRFAHSSSPNPGLKGITKIIVAATFPKVYRA